MPIYHKIPETVGLPALHGSWWCD